MVGTRSWAVSTQRFAGLPFPMPHILEFCAFHDLSKILAIFRNFPEFSSGTPEQIPETATAFWEWPFSSFLKDGAMYVTLCKTILIEECRRITDLRLPCAWATPPMSLWTSCSISVRISGATLPGMILSELAKVQLAKVQQDSVSRGCRPRTAESHKQKSEICSSLVCCGRIGRNVGQQIGWWMGSRLCGLGSFPELPCFSSRSAVHGPMVCDARPRCVWSLGASWVQSAASE